MVVVLPAPFGSEQGEHLAGGDGEVEAVEDALASEGLAEAADLDGWLHGGSSLCTYETVYDPNRLFTK